MTDPEFSFEPLIGWRVWNLVMRRAGRVPSLQPAAAGVGEWFPRRPYRATCRRIELPVSEQLAQHPSPVPDCTCGIYASSSLRTLVTSTPSMPAVSVVGTVALWGRVMEHERGWRAASAYPDRLTLVCAICLQEGSGTGEPAFVVADPVLTGPYPAVAVCRHHAAAVSVGPRVMSPAAVIRSALLDRYAVDLMPFDSVRSLFERDPVPVPFMRQSPAATPTRPLPKRVAPTTPVTAPTAGTSALVPVRREPSRPTRPSPPSVGRRIARGVGQVVTFIVQAVVYLIAASLFFGPCIAAVTEHDAAVTPTPAPLFVPEPEATDPSTLAVVRQPPDRDRYEFTAVCGIPHGAWVELKGCKNPAATLFGIAESPHQDHCLPGTTAFTQRPRYSICWISFFEADVVRHPAAANPFEDRR